MRRIHSSGGIEIGFESGPTIDIIPLDPLHPVSIEQAEDALLSAPFSWEDWKDMLKSPTVPKDLVGVMGISDILSVRFLYRGDPAQALHQIEEEEGVLSPILASSSYIAARYHKHFSPFAIPMIAMMADRLIKDTSPAPLIPQAEIRKLAEKALLEAADKPISAPLGAGNYPRFLISLAEMCWDINLVSKLFGKGLAGIGNENSIVLTSLASAWIAQQNITSLKVAGYNLPIKLRDYPFVWMEWMEWVESAIPAHILQQQTENRFPDLRRIVDRKEIPPNDLLKGLTQSLLEDAKTHGVYAPQGSFVLTLPEGYPLRELGIHALRVLVERDNLYATALDEKGHPCLSAFWKPGQTAGIWACPPDLQDILTVTLAALWRDLRIAGEEALPVKAKHTTHTQKAVSASEKRGLKAVQPASVRMLPARRFVLQGEREWGTSRERDFIQRRAHGVRGHLRRLQAGWKPSEDALQIAQAFGILTPAGYTFVRPHVRGSGAEKAETPAEVIVRAKGLASVMMLV